MRTILLLIFLPFAAATQDFQFSQYFSTPLALNPALTGYMDGLVSKGIEPPDVRINASHQNQFYRNAYDYSGGVVSVDWRRCLTTGQSKSALAIGMILQGDGSRFASYSNFRAGLSGAYHLQLSNRATLSIGASASWLNFGFDAGGLQFNEQFDGQGHNPNFGTPDPLINGDRRISQIDLNAGLGFTIKVRKHQQLSLGAAFYHLKPIEYTLAGTRNQLGVGFGLHGAYEFPKLTIHALYRRQSLTGRYSRQQQGMIGVFGSLSNGHRIKAGAFIRGKNHHRNVAAFDGFIPVLQLRLSNWNLSVSYDIILPTASSVTPGAIEVTASILLGKFGRCVYCPGI
jgi:type IX secretion system PorP/SprF family membrane protein